MNTESSPGNNKISEYIQRIREGESKDEIFRGLPEVFKSGIEAGLNSIDPLDEIPNQYKGLDSESLEFIWTIPEYIDKKKTERIKAQKERALKALKEKESQEMIDAQRLTEIRVNLGISDTEKNSEEVEMEEPKLDITERKKLHGWSASYELAKIAKRDGVDLSKLSREEYVDFAIQNSLIIDDDQLRASTWQRMETSARELVSRNKEKRKEILEESEKEFHRFSYDMQMKAAQDDRFLDKNIKVRQGTKDSNSWLFFSINKSPDEASNETYKSYISLKNLNKLTPTRFKDFMIALRDSQYNGDIKIFQDLLDQGIRLNDQIVMHGDTESDAKLALEIAVKFFGDEINQKSIGKDEVIDGKNKSYSQILAQKIRDAINKK